jgi:raffinose/stachyose/melibiose transport system permease protein
MFVKKYFSISMLYLFLSLLAIVWLLPIVFILFTSLKGKGEFFSTSVFAFPKHIEWKNYVDAWKMGKMNIYFSNSLYITAIKVPLGIFIEALAAFAIARLSSKWANFMFIFFLIGFMIPNQVTLIPLNIMLTKTGLVNTHAGLIILYVGFAIPFGILILRGFFRTIPKELDEAAKIDGCSNLDLFWRVILPISMPAVATLVILDSLGTWNEFLLSRTFINSDALRTVTTGLMTFKGDFNVNYTVLNAGVLISAIPVMIVYLVFQKYFVAGMAGSVKG